MLDMGLDEGVLRHCRETTDLVYIRLGLTDYLLMQYSAVYM